MLPAPYPLPPIRHGARADPRHYTRWSGPGPRPIQAIVLHSTEGTDSLRWLTTAPQSEVSAHTLVDRAGVLWELVSPRDLAHHCGTAVAPYTNRTTLGIELENLSRDLPPARVQDYPLAQVIAAAYRVATWRYSYNLSAEAVVRHGDIALPVGRRCDPSHFDLATFQRMVADWLQFFRVLPEHEHAAWIK